MWLDYCVNNSSYLRWNKAGLFLLARVWDYHWKLLFFSLYFLFSLPFCPLLSVIQTYLHSMNIIHRDLNSHNCLVREVRSRVRARVDIPVHKRHVFRWGITKGQLSSTGALQIQKTKQSFVSINRLSLLKTCCTCVTCSGNFQLTQTKKALYMCHMKTRGLYCRAHIWNVKLKEISSFPNELKTVLTLQLLKALSLYVSNKKW